MQKVWKQDKGIKCHIGCGLPRGNTNPSNSTGNGLAWPRYKDKFLQHGVLQWVYVSSHAPSFLCACDLYYTWPDPHILQTSFTCCCFVTLEFGNHKITVVNPVFVFLESGGRAVGENKAITAKKARFTPYTKFEKCRICKQVVHQSGAHYCQGCAYKKGICAMCGKVIIDVKDYKQSST